ncbi:MAG: aspartate racemase, partial [Stackebrandtia sp.]
MRTIGLIGGMSSESSAEYYRFINDETKSRLGGQHNAKSVLLTVDFDEIRELQLS